MKITKRFWLEWFGKTSKSKHQTWSSQVSSTFHPGQVTTTHIAKTAAETAVFGWPCAYQVILWCAPIRWYDSSGCYRTPNNGRDGDSMEENAPKWMPFHAMCTAVSNVVDKDKEMKRKEIWRMAVKGEATILSRKTFSQFVFTTSTATGFRSLTVRRYNQLHLES